MYFVRHGSTIWNRTGRQLGRSDIHLDREGEVESERVAEHLSSLPLDQVYASDLARARATAHAIAARHGLEVELDGRFREIDEGEWEGLTQREIEEQWPELWDRRFYCRRPSGESPADVCKRALEALHSIVASHPRGIIAVVSHQGLIRWVAASLMNLNEREARAILPPLRNCEFLALSVTFASGKLVGEFLQEDAAT